MREIRKQQCRYPQHRSRLEWVCRVVNGNFRVSGPLAITTATPTPFTDKGRKEKEELFPSPLCVVNIHFVIGFLEGAKHFQ